METPTIFIKRPRKRDPRTELEQRQRREKAWEMARAAAALLKSRYHAARVVAFGSLIEADRFHPWSDVDLAVYGLASDDYFEAVARVQDVAGEIKVDLVMAERCKPYLRSAIKRGKEVR